MKTAPKTSVKYLLMILVLSVMFAACKKNQDAKLPTISLKSGGNYTSSNGNVTTSDLIRIGTSSDKNEADLRTFKIYSSIGSGSFTLKKTYYLTPDEKSHYENDYEIIPKSVNTYETWKFEINDDEGNSNSVSVKLTVH
jgi:hypothetical protein